jgi:hypothetical protein
MYLKSTLFVRIITFIKSEFYLIEDHYKDVDFQSCNLIFSSELPKKVYESITFIYQSFSNFSIKKN